MFSVLLICGCSKKPAGTNTQTNTQTETNTNTNTENNNKVEENLPNDADDDTSLDNVVEF